MSILSMECDTELDDELVSCMHSNWFKVISSDEEWSIVFERLNTMYNYTFSKNKISLFPFTNSFSREYTGKGYLFTVNSRPSFETAFKFNSHFKKYIKNHIVEHKNIDGQTIYEYNKIFYTNRRMCVDEYLRHKREERMKLVL
jgi:hypothetical protein